MLHVRVKENISSQFCLVPQRLGINSRVDHESFNFNINTGHEVTFASKNMRKDIKQEDERKVLSMLVLESCWQKK